MINSIFIFSKINRLAVIAIIIVMNYFSNVVLCTVRPRFCEIGGKTDFVHKSENSTNRIHITWERAYQGKYILYTISRIHKIGGHKTSV